MRAMMSVLFVAATMMGAADAFAQLDEECPEAPPGFPTFDPRFRAVDGHEYCYLNELAERGYASVQLNLADRYAARGKDSEAFKWFRLAAEQGNVSAQYEVGSRYRSGKGVSKDLVEAVKWIRLVAEQGNKGAQFDLGVMYEDGQGVPRDDAEALKWINLAAEQGLASAQFKLGIKYDEGRGVAQDYVEAMKWYLLAVAESGGYTSDAVLRLGFFYKNGLGVPQDNVTAYMWYSIYAEARRTFHIDWEHVLEVGKVFAEDMTAADISKAEALAREWRESHRRR